jgi:hypothetical protein
MKKLVIATSVALLTTFASAGVNSNTGCGLGSVVLENQDTVLMQILGATTNGTSGNQTFGITSGTLNCSKPTALVSNEKIESFVADNMDGLAIDIAAGQGETLETLASLMSVEDKASFNSTLKANFSKIYSKTDVTSADVIDSIATIIG